MVSGCSFILPPTGSVYWPASGPYCVGLLPHLEPGGLSSLPVPGAGQTSGFPPFAPQGPKTGAEPGADQGFRDLQQGRPANRLYGLYYKDVMLFQTNRILYLPNNIFKC